jgi:enoyl-CoA hydratase/carnithine racemase
LARQIAFWPPVAMQMSKRVMQRGMESDLEEQLKYETHGIVFGRRAPHDVEEAAASFREKRPPEFTGE